MISYRYAVSEDVFDILNLDKEYFSNNFDEKFYIEYIENKKVLVAKEKDVVGLFYLIKFLMKQKSIKLSFQKILETNK